MFDDSFGTRVLGAALRHMELSALNEMLENEEAPLVSSSVAED